jgi:HlyD family secretion protein/adhesin transport system membrane fusion protein
MVVEANIITGSKSILRYLLKPIYRSIDRAFTER